MTTIAFRADGPLWSGAYRAANLLSRQGLQPLWSSRAFSGRRPDGSTATFPAGTIVVETSPADLPPHFPSELDVEAVELATTEGLEALPVRPVRIAVYGGGGAPYNHAASYGELGFDVDFVFPEDILAGALADYDLLAVPGGGARAMQGQLDPLGEDGCRAIADFVREGGLYLGCCAGAYDASLVAPSFLAVCPQQQQMRMINAAVWNKGDEWLGLQSPGVGVLRAKVAGEHPVTYGMPSAFPITHYNGPLYHMAPGTLEGVPDAVGLLAVAGTEDGFTPSEGFLGVAGDDRLVDRAVVAGAFNAVAGTYGKGRVVLFGSHPEMGLSLSMDVLDAPARMLANAAFWQAAATERARPVQAAGNPAVAAAEAHAGLTGAGPLIDAVVAAAEALLARDTTDAGWLDDALAMSTFGVAARTIWNDGLAGFGPAAAAMKERIASIEGRLKQAKDPMVGRSDYVAAVVRDLDRAINHQTPPDWNIDFGYEGLLQHLERARSMLVKADANFDLDFEPASNPYAYLDASPFHLAVGSYLAAAGVFANCGLLLRLHDERLKNALLIASKPAEAVH
ncbi:MAG TPA: BPL-N domain-containing protein [Kaistia sp.]|nr:BPL-N domain-containing protein [Kaistia sp.]